MVVPNDMGSPPSDGWCSRNSRGASPATRSSFVTWLSAPERRMRTFWVPPGAGAMAPAAGDVDSIGNALLAMLGTARFCSNDDPMIPFGVLATPSKGIRNVEISRTQSPQGGRRAHWGEQPRHLRGQGGEFRTVGCGRPALHRFRSGYCRGQHRPSPSAGHGGGGAAGAGICSYLLPCGALRI